MTGRSAPPPSDRPRREAPPFKLQRFAILVAGIVVLSACGTSDDNGGVVTVLRGSAETVNASRDAIGFDGGRVAGPRLRIVDVDGGWVVAGAAWWDGRTWHDQGAPSCLHPGSAGQPVELGVLEAKASDDGPGRGVVVWLKCLQS